MTYRIEIEVLLDMRGASAKFIIETTAGNAKAAGDQVRRLVEDGMTLLNMELKEVK